MELKIGCKFSKEFLVSEKMVNSFSEVTGDKNPIHIDDNFVRGTILKNKIAHGMLIISLATSVIGNYFPGRGSIIVSQSIKFHNPVYIEEIISIIIKIKKIELNGWVVLDTICYNSSKKIVFDGNVVVIPPTFSN
ncbi:MAG: hypothetical protein LLF93_01665 [Bacteroidales bacterium]|nr:hypothetical protein [Bacteroidales bacterium]